MGVMADRSLAEHIKLLPANNAGERNHAPSKPFSNYDHIGRNEVLGSKHFACPSERRVDFVKNQQDPMCLAYRFGFSQK